MFDLNNNKLYFRDPKMVSPEKGQEILIKIHRSLDAHEATLPQEIVLHEYFYTSQLYDGEDYIVNKEMGDVVVGWMPITEMDNIITDHTRGILRGFINHYSDGAYIRFKFTIDGQNYRCISCEDFLLDYGRLKGHLLDDYIVVDYEEKNYGPDQGYTYTLKLQQRKN